MNLGLRAFLAGIIDYAGLFPPARLPLEQAIRRYAADCRGDDAWMLGRFVCPAARLAEIDPLAEELFRDGAPLLFAALGRGGGDPAGFLAGLDADLDAINAFRQTHGSTVLVDALELRLPPADALPGLLDQVEEALTRTGNRKVAVSFEPSSLATAPMLADALRGRRGRGCKLRCGGLEAKDFPDAGQVAAVLSACVARGVPLKATAGLHHPFPRQDAAIGARIHGFVNLFAAGVLASTCGLGQDEVRAVLEDDDPAHFLLDDDGAGVALIAAARRDAVTSFGSCSFDEPRDDLRSLGWL
jgi:hypothetical protein